MTVEIAQQTRTIDDVTYRFTPLGAKVSRAIYPRIAIEASKIVMGVFNAGAGMTTLDPAFLQFLHDKFQPNCEVDLGNGFSKLEPMSEVLFSKKGALHEMKWLRFVMEAQYPDFLGALKPQLMVLLSKAMKAVDQNANLSPSPTESIKESSSS